jgi:tRNA nucleotidyltransferase (CCA-adding enzyme)
MLDLRNGIIRTPLPPRETFLDDPLRVLRCIRFASRFGFTLDPELQAAAKNAEIQVGFPLSVSPRSVLSLIPLRMHSYLK